MAGPKVEIIHPTGHVYHYENLPPEEDPASGQLRFEFVTESGQTMQLSLSDLIGAYLYAAKYGAAKKCTTAWFNDIANAYHVPDEFMC